MPAWSDSRTAFKNGYSIDFSTGLNQVGFMQAPSQSPTWTRFITIAVNVGKTVSIDNEGAQLPVKLNLCEVVIRGNTYST